MSNADKTIEELRKCCEHFPDCMCDIPLPAIDKKVRSMDAERMMSRDMVHFMVKSAEAYLWMEKERDRWKHVAMGGRKFTKRTEKVIAELHRWDPKPPKKWTSWAELAEAATVMLIDTYEIDIDRALDVFTTPQPMSTYDEVQARRLVEKKAAAMGLKKKVKDAEQGAAGDGASREGSAGSEDRSGDRPATS